MPPGRLEVICGPMFAGKTTELLRRIRAAEAGGSPVLLIKPRWDDRYAAAEVVSHNGDRHAAAAVTSAAEITTLPTAPVIAIDEAHFFGSSLTPICIDLIARGHRLIIAGVERDHRGHPFEPFPALLCEADEVLKMSGSCALCGGPSLHSQRLTNDPSRIVVGGADLYQARCRSCFEPGV